MNYEYIHITPTNTDDTIYNQTMNMLQQALNYLPITVRMWIDLIDIDNNYLDFSNARNNFYKQKYKLYDRFYASTCVGSTKEFKLKLLIVPNIKKEQIDFMELPDFLPHTTKYDVTFERGIKIKYKNSSKYYISGTASIDKNGEILYTNNVVKQTKRVNLIIKKMLEKYNASTDNITYMKWYIRNKEHVEQVKDEVYKLMGDEIELDFKVASICRPQWLVEAECIAYK